jgi:hypothetical protein
LWQIPVIAPSRTADKVEMDITPAHQRPAYTDYIGDSDHDVLAFISNLARSVQEFGPQAFDLTADDLALIVAAHEAYEPLFQVSKTNDRTPSVIAAKDVARDEADHIGRSYAQIIKNRPGVSDALKVIAGVPIEKTTRTPKGQPRTFPRLHVAAGLRSTLVPEVDVRFRDVALATGRMPREDGITHMILHAEIVLCAPGARTMTFTFEQSSLRVLAYVTRNPYTVKLGNDLLERFGLRLNDRSTPAPPVLPCVSAIFRGQWLSAKGAVGPLGPPAMFNVAMNAVPVNGTALAAESAPHTAAHAELALAA